MKRHLKLYTLGAVLDRCEHGDDGEMIDGNDGMRAASLTHPCPTQSWAHNDVHDARGPGSKAAGLAVAYKLIESAQDRWWAFNGSHPVALVCAGATFRKGIQIENKPTGDQVAA